MSNHQVGDGTIGKAVAVLDQIAGYERPVRFSEILKDSLYPKATLYRLVQTLTNQGMLSYNEENRTYALGFRLVKLAHSAWRQSSLAPIARSFLDLLATETEETLHLAQMNDGQVLYIDKRNAASPVEMFSSAGKTGPGHCTGVGKAILAYMTPKDQAKALTRQSFFKYTKNTIITKNALKSELLEITKTGLAFDHEEHEPGIICIAAPILDSRGRSIAAISLTSTTNRNSIQSLKAHTETLKNTATKIAQAAENWQFPN
ncbi:MAG: IclR family transcriptional regulator [Deltaproteobacteria bacterium]|nr:IclR family transcriptional regulator [Deltaproteobacteria bacterium]